MIELKVNGALRQVDADPDTPLLWVVRENLGLTGTKYGCGISQCGACTLHLDGETVRSCQTPLSAAEGKEVTTIEGLAGELGGALVQAWTSVDVPQCGFCQTGQIMQAAELLVKKPQPTDRDIDAAMTGNLCRCGTYLRIRRAIHEAAQQLATGGAQ